MTLGNREFSRPEKTLTRFFFVQFVPTRFKRHGLRAENRADPILQNAIAKGGADEGGYGSANAFDP